MFDLENIDYSLFESFYGDKMTPDIISYKGPIVQKGEQWTQGNVSHLYCSEYNQYKVPYTCFFTKEIKEKVYQFYKKDFTIFEKYGLHYDFEI